MIEAGESVSPGESLSYPSSEGQKKQQEGEYYFFSGLKRENIILTECG
jgi:hypothetical protein